MCRAQGRQFPEGDGGGHRVRCCTEVKFTGFAKKKGDCSFHGGGRLLWGRTDWGVWKRRQEKADNHFRKVGCDREEKRVQSLRRTWGAGSIGFKSLDVFDRM